MDKQNDDGKLLLLVEKALAFEGEAQVQYIESQTQPNSDLRKRAYKLLESIKHDKDATLATGQGLNTILQNTKPERIGNYKIIDEIGRGGMGVVYRAERFEADFEHQVAIKLVSLRSNSDKLTQRLRSERRLLSQLKHPHIAQFYDGGETDQAAPYFVMELVYGKPLNHYLEQDDKILATRLDLFRQICSAIAYAHANTIIHRDLSPSNILVGENHIVKVIDFGISSTFEASSSSQGSGFTQTVGYSAPERLLGVPATTLGDIYSLGIILHDLLKGLTPKRKFELTAIANKASGHDPESRYQSVDALVNDIENYTNNVPVQAVNGGSTYRINCFVSANKLAVASASVFIVSTAVAAVLFASLYFRAVSAEIVAVERFNDSSSLRTCAKSTNLFR